jgi:hypothetical protein
VIIVCIIKAGRLTRQEARQTDVPTSAANIFAVDTNRPNKTKQANLPGPEAVCLKKMSMPPLHKQNRKL